jgi:dihydrodipicolinate synthase/N-acetylneuraminate lyase
MTERICGVLAPVVTPLKLVRCPLAPTLVTLPSMSLIPSAPFKADLAPDDKRFIAHCKRLLSQNCGLAVFGTNSEANLLSMDVLNAVAPVPRFTSRDALS